MASASHSLIMALPILALAFAICMQPTFCHGTATVSCEKLNKSRCTYAVSSGGHRCVLEKTVKRGSGLLQERYVCRTSTINAAAKLSNWIETDWCVDACGLDRDTLGISSDALLDSHITRKLCSSGCLDACPNIIDLYSKLADGEGSSFPKFCETQKTGIRRELTEFKSSNSAAAAGAPGDAEAELAAAEPTNAAAWEAELAAEPTNAAAWEAELEAAAPVSF